MSSEERRTQNFELRDIRSVLTDRARIVPSYARPHLYGIDKKIRLIYYESRITIHQRDFGTFITAAYLTMQQSFGQGQVLWRRRT